MGEREETLRWGPKEGGAKPEKWDWGFTRQPESLNVDI